MLSGDITSIVKKVVIRLPSNSNLILEEIDNYNSLAAMLQMLSVDGNKMQSAWNSGLNSFVDHNRPEGQQRARRLLNLNEGGYRTFTFQLNLCSVLSLEQYLPLSLLNGIMVEIHLAPAQEAFHYDPANEQWEQVMGSVEGMIPIEQYRALSAGAKTAVHQQLTTFYNRPEPASQALFYELRAFTLHASAIWMNAEYVKRLYDKATGDNGINLFFDTYRFNQIPNEGSLVLHMNLTEQYQNLKNITFATLSSSRLATQSEHSFNIFESFLKSYKFRIGSRSWQVVSNTEPAISYTQSLLSLGLLHRGTSNTASFTVFPRTQNVHVFDFEKVHDDLQSGEDTTNGRNLRMELQFQSHSQIGLLDEGGEMLQDGDGTPIVLKKQVQPSQCVVYAFQLFTRMINVSNKGIAVTE
jgi:hypothetical protein